MSRGPVIRWREELSDSGLDTMAKAVGFVISIDMNASGVGYPGKERIRRRASVKSLRTVDAAVLRLEAAGFLTVKRSHGWHANVYTATLPTPQRAAGSTPQQDAGITPQDAAGFDDENPANDDVKPRNSRRQTPQLAAGEVGSSTRKPSRRAHAREAADKRQSQWVEDLGSYTGARQVYNGRAPHFVYDPLGKDNPRAAGITDWPYPKPTREEIRAALDARTRTSA